MRRWIALLALVVALGGSVEVASAHGGGLDRNGGHYCREAGYRSGKCRPLNSYHCHRSGCVRKFGLRF